MSSDGPWVGSWKPHRPRGPIAAMYGSPGPKYGLPSLVGEKSHSLTKPKAPSHSFGTRYKFPTPHQSPGPQYVIPSNTTRIGRDGTPRFSIHGRPKDPTKFQPPGPGQYSPEKATKSVFKSAPAFSLSARVNDPRKAQIPGPARYQLPQVIGANSPITSSSPMYSLCGRSKHGGFAEDLKNTPGPAAYKVVDSSLIKIKAPHFSMTGRNFPPPPGTRTPGPGTYRPEMVTSIMSKAPSFTFGVHHSEYSAPLIVEMDN